MDDDDRTSEGAAGLPGADDPRGEHYQVRVSGRLSSRWGAWFDGLTLSSDDDGTTVISGPIVDQAALHGLLQQLRDLGVTLLSLTRTAPGEPIEHPVLPPDPKPTDTPGATS